MWLELRNIPNQWHFWVQLELYLLSMNRKSLFTFDATSGACDTNPTIPKTEKARQRHTEANAKCWDIVQFLHINEVRLLLLYPKLCTWPLQVIFSIQVSNGTIYDPCFNLGYSRVMNVSDLINSPCTKTYKTTLPFLQLKIHGTGNYQQCQESVFRLFDNSDCPYSHCAFDKIFLPQPQGQFGVSCEMIRYIGWDDFGCKL